MQFRVRPSSKKSNNNDLSSIEFPTIKSFNQNQPALPRSIASKIEHLQSSLATFQQLFRKERQTQNAGSLDLQKRLDRIQYKVFTAQQDIRQLNDIREIKAARDVFSTPLQGQASKNEIIVLKQVIMQERQAQKQNLKHQNALIQQLTLKHMRTEQEFRQLVAQQRMEYESRLSGQGEEIREIEVLKQRKIEQQYEMMKGVISNAERKIYDQLERKIQNEMIVKDYIQERLRSVREEVAIDHKDTIVTESKFIKQTKQSLESLFALINNVRKQLSEELSETQKLSVKSIQKISGAIDIIRQKNNEDSKHLNNSYQEVSNELVQIRNFVTTKLQENRQFMSEFQEQTYDRLQQSDAYDKGGNHGQATIDGQRFSLFQKEMNQWKSITQQKNLNVFKEISNTLKTMKTQWRKENDELVSQVAALDESLRNLKKNGPAELKKNIQGIVTIFNNQFDVLADELESLTEMISLAKKQNQKYTKEQINKLRNDTLQQAKVIINQKGKENNAYADKAISKNEQTMKNFIYKQIKYATESLSKKVDKVQVQKNQLESAMKKANILTAAQLEDYSIKLKSFNDSYKEYLQELRKEDLKKRMDLQQAMRNNASNLMDICYKKCQFLVDGLKKSIETSQMKERLEHAQLVQGVKDELKKEVQGARLEWQKQLSTGLEKQTKQRENSEQILHETIEQSLTNTKTKLVNDLNDAKIDLEKKLNDFKIKEVQKDVQNEKESSNLKQTLQKTLQEQQKHTAQSIQSMKKEFTTQIQQMEKENIRTKEEIQTNVKTMIDDLKKTKEAEANASQQAAIIKQKQNKEKLQLDKRLQEISKEMAISNKKIDDINLKLADMAKTNTQKQAQTQTQNKKVGQKSLNELREQFDKKMRQLEIKISQLAQKNEDPEQDQAIANLRKSVNKIEAMVFSEQAKNKALFDRLAQDINKLTESLNMIASELRE